MRLIGKAVFSEHERSATKGIRFDDVRTGFQVFAMDSQHHVGPRDHQIFVAAFQVRSAEIGRREVRLLQHGAHRAIQDEDALTEKFAKGQALLYQVSHVFGIIPWEAPQGKAASRVLPPEREHPPPASPRETLNAMLIVKAVKNFRSP